MKGRLSLLILCILFDCVFSLIPNIPQTFKKTITSRLRQYEKDEQGYIIKSKESGWFDGLSSDAGNSVADPRAVSDAVKDFINIVKSGEQIMLADTVKMIDNEFDYFEVPFNCGDAQNAINENATSGKIFSLALIAGLDKDTTLNLFGEVYRDLSPSGSDHQNIREFIKSGIDGLKFPTGYCIVSKSQAYEDTDSAMETQSVNMGDNEWDADSDSWIP